MAIVLDWRKLFDGTVLHLKLFFDSFFRHCRSKVGLWIPLDSLDRLCFSISFVRCRDRCQLGTGEGEEHNIIQCCRLVGDPKRTCFILFFRFRNIIRVVEHVFY